MRDKYGVDQDPNCYPNTDTLINLLNIQSESELDEAELELTSFRLEQFTPDFSSLTFEYLKQIHFFLFQDIYAWAGQVRTVDISKGDTRFCTTSYIEREAEKQFAKLANLDNLKGLDKDEFVEHLADFFCEMNIVHPFREGNGRALRLFCEVLAMQAGYELSWQGVSKEAWLDANIYGFNVSTELLIVIFDRCSMPIE
ncbi:MAG: putative adenosine monophosphate-protein transferase Fic [Litorilituus sp.]|jgi:cell filamentation protein|nr:putative adenosine monophosphate-protein transferase Fic [Litorilituus sp.]